MIFMGNEAGSMAHWAYDAAMRHVDITHHGGRAVSPANRLPAASPAHARMSPHTSPPAEAEQVLDAYHDEAVPLWLHTL
jgi:hypothetical protein